MAMRADTHIETEPSITRVATKLFVPPTRTNMVERSRLINRLNGGLSGKITLISAPAGFGKTSLASAWLNDVGIPAAWLSLDADDNEPNRFLDYLISALRNIDPNFGSDAHELVRSSHPSPLKPAMIGLVNELASLSEKCVIVLDDYHVIQEPMIHESLAFMIDNLPPRAHLMIASRIDPPFPMARLRAKGELNEFRVADLRFDASESAVFLNDQMKLGLTEDEVKKLGLRTEGWITGLQLSALSLQRTDNPSQMIDEFAGNDRFILDYLIEEVMAGLSHEVQDFLTRTAILDRLCGPLCDALLGKSGSTQLLEQLERENLFLFPLDNKGQWFRYHHLFADMLRFRIKQSGTSVSAELHRKASLWFSENNLIEEAVSHALAAEDWELALNLIEPIATEVTSNSRFRIYGRWLSRIPVEKIANHPLLCAWYGIVLLNEGEIRTSEKFLQLAETAAGGKPKLHFVRTMVWSGRAFLALGCGKTKEMLHYSRKAVDSIKPDLSPAQIFAIHSNSLVCYVTGKMPEAEESFRKTIPMAIEANHFVLQSWATVYVGLALSAMGKPRQAFETISNVLQFDMRHFPEYRLFVYALSANLNYEWNNLESARHYLEESYPVVEEMGGRGYWLRILDYLQYLAPLLWALGERKKALELLDAETKRLKHFGNFIGVRQADAIKNGILLREGEIEAVQSWVEENEIESLDSDYFCESAQIVVARLQIAQGQDQKALKLLGLLLTNAERDRRMRSVFEIMLLQCVALSNQHNENDAVAVLEKLLTLTCPENYIRLFTDEGGIVSRLLQTALKHRGKSWEKDSPRLLDYVRTLIRSFGESAIPPTLTGPTQSEDLPWWYANDPLSDREIEVLQLVAEGLSNQAIGNKLFIAAGTVKRHVNNIYSKLDVHSRVQAVELARKFGLIPPTT